MKESKFLGALLPSSPDFLPITEAIRGKYTLPEVNPEEDPIEEIYVGNEVITLEELGAQKAKIASRQKILVAKRKPIISPTEGLGRSKITMSILVMYQPVFST